MCTVLGGESEWNSPSVRPRGKKNNLCKKGRGVFYSNIVQKYRSQVVINSWREQRNVCILMCVCVLQARPLPKDVTLRIFFQ